MRKFKAAALPLVLMCVVGLATAGLAGCETASSATTTPPNEITLVAADFAQHTLTVTAGTTVLFNNPASGVTHVLCIGANAKCRANAAGPLELTADGGLTISAGQVKEIVFATPGTYPVACALHPAMNLVVTVQ
jgi:plastocyanin